MALKFFYEKCRNFQIASLVDPKRESKFRKKNFFSWDFSLQLGGIESFQFRVLCLKISLKNIGIFKHISKIWVVLSFTCFCKNLANRKELAWHWRTGYTENQGTCSLCLKQWPVNFFFLGFSSCQTSPSSLLLDAVISYIIFLISFSSCLLLLHRNKIDLCIDLVFCDADEVFCCL